MSAEERAQVGISDSLMRLSVGIESTEELIEDFAQALAAAT
jgi:cystathionine beta-lyase/cystathionine gamma-synthase